MIFKCFKSPDQFDRWLKQALLVPRHHFIFPCIDCNPEFQKQKVSECKCAYPATVFKLKHLGSLGTFSDTIEELEIVGQLPVETKKFITGELCGSSSERDQARGPYILCRKIRENYGQKTKIKAKQSRI